MAKLQTALRAAVMVVLGFSVVLYIFSPSERR